MSAVLQNNIAARDADESILAAGSARERPSRSLSLKARLAALVAMAIVFVVGMAAWQVYSERRMALDDNTAELVGVVNGARGIVEHYYQLSRKGEMTEEQAQAEAKRALQGFVYPGQSGGRDYLIVIDGRGVTIMHGTLPSQVGNVSLTGDVQAAIKARLDEIKANGYAVELRHLKKPGTDLILPKMNVYVAFDPWGWMIGSGSFADTLQARLDHRMWVTMGTAAALIVVLLIGAAMAARGVLRQIGGEPDDVVQMMNRAAHGDLAQHTGDAVPGSVVHAFGQMLRQLGRLVRQVREEAAAMKRDADRIAASVEQVSAAAAQQSDATSSMAASVEELTVSVASISDAATQTQRNSEGVSDKCREGETKVLGSAEGMKRIAAAVGEASEKIRGLEERAVQINSIAASIKEIAAQTNLLALNAAIEAARAGDQGRGFSVVADEVRKLAERTSSATIEIEEMVNAVQRETSESTQTMENVLPLVSEGTQMADQVAESLREISERAGESLDRVREVAHATKEQSSASTSIAQQVEGIAQMVEETTAAMGSTAQSAREMRQMAERLDGLVGAFKV